MNAHAISFRMIELRGLGSSSGRLWHVGERSHWECRAAHDRDRRRREDEPLKWEPIQASEVLDDGNAGRKKTGMGGTRQVFCVVDVSEVDPDESDVGRDKSLHHCGGQEGRIRPVLLRSPSRIPTRAHQDRASAEGSFVDPM